jgi:acetyl esterase
MAVGGTSSGGTLATVTALRIRDEGGPRLAGQLLIYPNTDLEMTARPSLAEYGEGYWLTAKDIAWFRSLYLSDSSEARHPHASPIHAQDLRRLPPALVVTAEYDPLRDEGERYGARLREAGVATIVSRYDGVIHGFFSLPGLVEKSDMVLEEASAWLRSVFANAIHR